MFLRRWRGKRGYLVLRAQRFSAHKGSALRCVREARASRLFFIMKSMTGFGRGIAVSDGIQLTVEISAVNSRKQIEMRVSMPRELALLEPDIRSFVQRRLSRGTLTVSVSYRSIDASSKAGLPVDFGLASSAYKRLKEFAEAEGAPLPTVGDVLLIPGVLKTSDSSVECLKPLLDNALAQALDSLDAMRCKEGEALKQDLTARGQAMLAGVERIVALEKGSALAMKERLLERIRALQIDIGPDDERLAKEVAFLVDRSDITEEMVRLKSHLAQYAQLMEETADVGRKLDFLCQELNREVNTLGSKCSETSISDEALALKIELSKIREQILNVE